jgi:hypothetical protein
MARDLRYLDVAERVLATHILDLPPIPRTSRRTFQAAAVKRAYIVVTNPSDFELQLFQERKIEVIPTFDLDRSRAVSNLLTELAS